MVRAIVLLGIFFALLTTSAMYEDFKALMALVGVFTMCALADRLTKPDDA